jgi:hypothetical protein
MVEDLSVIRARVACSDVCGALSRRVFVNVGNRYQVRSRNAAAKVLGMQSPDSPRADQTNG